MTAFTVLALLCGFVLLIVGANTLVKGAGRLALGWGISPLVIGLTVVAFGTSAPEMAVSVAGSIGGRPDVALGNIMGSTIANVFLILGISAVCGTLVVAHRLVRIEVPVMIAIASGAFLLALGGGISRFEGALLLAIAVVYTGFTVRTARRGAAEEVKMQYEGRYGVGAVSLPRPWYVHAGKVALGVIGLVAGSQLLVTGASDVAAVLGLSELVIGLTVVAVGTSLPEVATSVAATLKGDRDIAVGNVIGSNIFNLSAVLGLAGISSTEGIPVARSLLEFDLPIVIAACVACLPIFFTGHKVMRWEGVVFLGYYAAYLAYLVLRANEHDAAGDLRSVMFTFVAPLTALTLLILVYREVTARRERSSGSAATPIPVANE